MDNVDLKGCVRISDLLKRLYSYGDVDEQVLKAKAAIGTDVHKAIVDDCEGNFVAMETDRARAYFESYKRWENREISLITQVPRLYCFDLMITGECDGLLDSLHLIDWKCSASPNLKIWNMQAHYYWYLLRQNGYSISESMYWVNLRHSKHVRKANNSNIGFHVYTAQDPVIYEFTFDENVLSQCIDEAVKYWEEYYSAKDVE